MFKNRVRAFSVFTALLFCSTLFAQIPNGYYDDALYKSEYALKTALHQIIKDHNSVSYNSLWEHFKTTDRRADGKVWDMYSNCTFVFGNDQCGNYSGVCDCYNREHSFPKSWFNDAAPMYTDLYQLYPTDGYVNNRRGNYPFGETSNGANWGTGKLGNCTFPGYSGTVFEPADEYKGDFARTYFYMATRYQDKIANWNATVLAGNNTSVYVAWTINLLLKWHEQDPVSEKEINRNNAVYQIQRNRNPFIDYPELADLIWGDDFGKAFNPAGEADIFGEPSVCEESSHLYRTEKNNSNYVWSVQNGAIEGAADRDSVVVRWDRSGEGVVLVRYSKTGQEISGEFPVEIKQRPNPTITGDRQVLMNTEGYQYYTESSMSGYEWSFAGNVSLSEGGGNNHDFAVLDFGEEGTATISVNYSKNGCEAVHPTVMEVQIVKNIGIDALVSWEKNVAIAPNPATFFTRVNFTENFAGTVQVMDVFGKIVNDLKITNSTTQQIDLSTYNSGIYILRILPENGAAIYKKVIVIK